MSETSKTWYLTCSNWVAAEPLPNYTHKFLGPYTLDEILKHVHVVCDYTYIQDFEEKPMNVQVRRVIPTVPQPPEEIQITYKDELIAKKTGEQWIWLAGGAHFPLLPQYNKATITLLAAVVEALDGR